MTKFYFKTLQSSSDFRWFEIMKKYFDHCQRKRLDFDNEEVLSEGYVPVIGNFEEKSQGLKF